MESLSQCFFLERELRVVYLDQNACPFRSFHGISHKKKAVRQMDRQFERIDGWMMVWMVGLVAWRDGWMI